MNNGNKQPEIAGIPVAEWSATLQRHPSLATPDFQKWLTPKWIWLSAVLSKAGPPSSTARLLIAALATRMNGECFCYPSIEMLAEETGLSNRAILNHVATLNGQWLEVTTRKTGGTGRPRNVYAALIPDNFPTEIFIDKLTGERKIEARQSLYPEPMIWKALRRSIFERDDYTCTYCGDRGVRLECDHVIPVSRGGGHDLSNLVTACFTCNRSKRDKLVSEWLEVAS